MNVAYVSHHKRPNYEYAWFANMPVDKVVFITSEAPTGETNPKIEYRTVGYKESGWENRFFASTALRVFYKDFEDALADVDIVVVLEVFSSLSRQFVEYCRQHNKPVVVLVYELIDTHPIYRIPRYKGNTNYCLRYADHFVAVSESAGRHLVKLGADKQKITVVYPGIDLDTFTADRHGRKGHGLAFVGRLDPHKGIDLTLNIYKKLVTDFPDITLDIVGEGMQQTAVEAAAREYRGVTYLGSVPNAQLPRRILNKNSLYLLPARDTRRFGQRIGAEQFGFSVVEAMACGLAVATTECGALPEIVTAKNIVCPQNDEHALYIAVKALLQDKDRLQKTGLYNQKLAARRYDLQQQAARFAEVLGRVRSRKVN